MEARRPSNQAVNARGADARLKSAKPRRVRLRSLAARAVCGFLTIAALLTLPVQTEAQTTIWSSTLNVRNTDTNTPGCNDTDDNSACADYLGSDSFIYNGSTYGFLWILSYPSDRLEIRFHEFLGTDTQDLTLNVDGTAFAFEDADESHPKTRSWNNPTLNWTPGDTVSLTLTDFSGRPSVPAAPSIGATEGSNSSLDVGWLEPANAGPFVKYYLRYRKATDQAWTTGPQDVTISFANITTGLRAGTKYEVQVRAKNSNGDSEWSPSGTGQTDSGIRPDVPRNLNTTANGQNRIDLNWTSPVYHGTSSVRSYKIEVRSDASNWLTLLPTTGNTDTEYSHTGLPANTTRHYRVSAINTQGTGPPSEHYPNILEASATTGNAGGSEQPQQQQSQTPLAASFVSVPATHDGETPFWLELTFDAPVAQGSKPQLRELLNVTGGSETRFRRKDGQLDHWQIRVDPSSQNAVTVMLSPSPPCGETGAVCTEDGRTFTTGLATQIHGPASGNNWSGDATGTAVTPVPALPLAGIGLLGLLLALLGSRRRLNDRRQLNASRGK